MRIDEVIQEAPVGYGQRIKNFAQSKLGFTRDMRARGQGQRDVAQIANNVSAEISQKVGQVGIDVRKDDQVLSQDYTDLVLGVLKDMGFAPEFQKLYTQEREKILKPFMDATGKNIDSNKIRAKGGAKKVTDQALLNMVQMASKSGLVNKFPDTDGDGKPDAPQDGAQDDNAKLSPADSALKSALDKLDPQMQAKALQYLQSKK